MNIPFETCVRERKIMINEFYMFLRDTLNALMKVDIIHLEFKKAVDKVPHQRKVKIPWYWNQHNKVDRAMAYRHETKCRSGRIRFKC